jgi:RHS repeat-associated protein
MSDCHRKIASANELIARAQVVPKTRRPSRPTLGSKVRRLTAKSQRSTINGSSVNRNRWIGATYDGAGNLASVIGTGRGYSYDAENRMTASTEPNTAGPIQYVYDGDGRRMQKTVGTAVTVYVYDASGEVAAEYGSATDTGTAYLTADHLGSTRLMANGSEIKHYDYFPFGEDIQQGIGARDTTYPTGAYPGVPDSQSLRFTGKERDAETGLDWFSTRYMSSAQGRFTSPDSYNITQEMLKGRDATEHHYLGYAYFLKRQSGSCHRRIPETHYPQTRLRQGVLGPWRSAGSRGSPGGSFTRDLNRESCRAQSRD